MWLPQSANRRLGLHGPVCLNESGPTMGFDQVLLLSSWCEKQTEGRRAGDLVSQGSLCGMVVRDTVTCLGGTYPLTPKGN